MVANLLALYLAAIRLTCNMACIFGFVFGVNAWVWGSVGMVVLEEVVGRLGVLVWMGCVAAVVAYVGAVFLFSRSSVRFAFSSSFRVGQDPLTAMCDPSQLQHLMLSLHLAKK